MRAGKIIFYVSAICVVGTVIFVILSLIWNVAILGLARLLGLNPEYFVNFIWLAGLLLILMPKRFLRIKRPTTLTATQIIFAPISEVWDQIMPRPRDDHFLPTTPEIRAVEGHDDLFDYVIPATQNGPMKGQIALRNRVVEKAAPHYLALFLENGADAHGIGIDAESSEYRLDVVDEGTTRVTFTDTVSHISPLFLITLFFVNPARDSLRRLKSVCEGTPDTSWAGKMVAKLEDGSETGIDSDSALIMTTVVIVMSALAIGVVLLVLTLLPAS